MSMFFHLFIAHLKDVFRDLANIFWFFIFPLIFVFLYGLIFSNVGANQTFNISVAAPDQSIATTVFRSIPVFKVTETDPAGAIEDLEKDKVDAAVIVSTGPEQKEQITIHYKADEDSTGPTISSIIKQVFTEMELESIGLERRYEVIENIASDDTVRMVDYILPGILGMALMQLGLLGSLQFVTYRERNIIKRLALAPITKASFLGSEILLRLLMGLVQGMVIMTIGHFVFKVPILGSVIAIIGLVILGLAVFISLGFLLSSFAKTVDAANGILQIVQFPMMFLSGIFFPLEFLPAALKPVVKVLPLTYFGDSLRQIILGIPGDFAMSTNLLILSGWLIVTFVLAVRFFRWE